MNRGEWGKSLAVSTDKLRRGRRQRVVCLRVAEMAKDDCAEKFAQSVVDENVRLPEALVADPIVLGDGRPVVVRSIVLVAIGAVCNCVIGASIKKRQRN